MTDISAAEFNRHIANRIKLLRAVKNLKQVDLGEHLGYRVKYAASISQCCRLRDIESSRTPIKIESLYHLAQICRVTVDFFFDKGTPSAANGDCDKGVKLIPDPVIRMFVGYRLRYHRLTHGYVIEDVADYLRVDRTLIANYELGLVSISLYHLYSLTDAFDLKPSYFFQDL